MNYNWDVECLMFYSCFIKHWVNVFTAYENELRLISCEDHLLLLRRNLESILDINNLWKESLRENHKMISLKILLSLFVLLNFIELFAANANKIQRTGIVFETEDTNKNRTATHVSNMLYVKIIFKKKKLDYVLKIEKLIGISLRETV